MTTLVLGVVEVAYAPDGARAPPRITKKGKVHKTDAKRGEDTGPATTVTVAKILEEKYHVMGHFVEALEDKLTGALVHSAEGALEDLFAGSPVIDPFSEAEQEIQAAFRQFLLQAEIESMGVEGVPTKAALEGKSSRFKSGYGPRRPSFIDTGLYSLSMRSWVE